MSRLVPDFPASFVAPVCAPRIKRFAQHLLFPLALLGADAALGQSYCALDFATVEPISRVVFAGIDNVSNPVVGTSPALENFAHISGVVEPGVSYSIALEGNTGGDYHNYFSVFIDWNGDFDFDDDDEQWVISDSLRNSNGVDGKQVTGSITIPAGIANGSYHMRVVKKYGSHVTSPCGNNSYGQAEEYRLTVGDLSPTAPVVIASIPLQYAQVGAAFTLELSNYIEDRSDANSLTFDVSGLPDGVTFDTATGVIGGNPSAGGTYPVSVKATNSGNESVTTGFTLVVGLFAGGNGSEASPYKIASPAQLDAIRLDLHASYELAADIDLGAAPWNAGEGWMPIGDWDHEFRGSLDGKGHTITGLTINRPNMDYVGLFGGTWQATIKNLRLENVAVTGGDYTGALAGMAGRSEISDIVVSGHLTSDGRYTGGIAGQAGWDTVIRDGAVDVTITGDAYVGGLAGSLFMDVVVENGYATGTMTGDFAVGGLAGYVTHRSEISDSHAHVTVVADMFAGGLAGEASETSIIRRSHAVGSVAVSDRVAGGLFGQLSYSAEVTDSYAHTTVTANGDGAGGLVGSLWGGKVSKSYAVAPVSGYLAGALAGSVYSTSDYTSELRDSYWSTDYAGGLDAYGENENPGASSVFSGLAGYAQAALQDAATYSGWDFTTVWDSAPGQYPFHRAIGAESNGSMVPAIPDQNVILSGALSLDVSAAFHDPDYAVTGYSATGLPPGVTIGNDGVISGTPSAIGRYTVSITATYAGTGPRTGSVVINVALFNGAGTMADPWQISSPAQLDQIRNFLDDHFVLTADIDLGTAPWNLGEGWMPIGDWYAEFRGSLDGNGHTIKGLTIDRPGMTYVGLFGHTWYASITDLRLEDVNVTGGDFTGALVGMAGSTGISGVFVSGTITSDEEAREYVGGIVGSVEYDSVIRDSEVDVTVAGFYSAGGLAGSMYGSAVIENSYAAGTVSGDYAVGGLVGDAYSGAEIRGSHAHATVIADSHAGGIAGIVYGAVVRESHAVASVLAGQAIGGGAVGLLAYGAELHDSYAHAVVSGTNTVGGLVGDVVGSTVTNSYAVSAVSGSPAGGLAGRVYSTGGYPSELRDSYWSTDHAGGLDAYGENENQGASSVFSGLAGYAQAALQDAATYSGWDFTTIWDIEPGLYPFHRAIGAESNGSTAPPIPDHHVLVDGSLSLDVSAAFHDPDHAVVAYSATGLPPGVTIGNDGVIGGTPTATGSYTVSITATYAGTGPRTGSVVIHVLPFAGGAGTSVNPWEIATAAQLDAMRDFPTGHFMLIADIDLGGANGPFANGGAGWEPLGGTTLGAPFTGSFDGGGYVVSGLYINRPGVDHAGLFGTTEGAEIRNVGLVDVDVTGGYAVGGLVGYQSGGGVSNSFVTGIVSSSDGSAGGLIGISEAGVLANSYSRAAISTGETGNGGGLIGALVQGAVDKSYASGSLGGAGSNGGLLGLNLEGQIANSFWNSDTAGATGIGCNFEGGDCVAEPATIAGLGSAQLRQQATFSGWDFAATWGMHGSVNDGYPYLLWQDVVITNRAPVVDTPIGARTATQGVAFSLDVSAHFSDPDDDELAFNATGLPASLSINSAGVISGTPTNADALAGTFTVTVTASDGELSASDSFTLSVANVNDAPVVVSAIGNRTGTQGVAFSLDVSAHFSDPDGDTLSFSATGLPASLSISAAGAITGTPTNADALNGPYTVTVSATDGALSVSDTFTLTIANANDAPVVVAAIGNQAATQGVAFSLDVSANFGDPDGDTLSFSATGLPAGLGISAEGLISGTPTNADALGSPYTVTVTATDGTLNASTSFTLSIANVNDAPVIVSAIGNRTGTQDAAYSLDVSAHFSDPDGDTLTFTATGLPASLGINAAGLITGTPTNADVANSPFSVTVTASDGTLSASDTFTLVVDDVNDAPVVVSAIGNQAGTQGVAFSLDVSAHFSDPDGDTLSFSASGLPAGLDISAAGLVSGTPTNADALGSPYAITITATDGMASVSAGFELSIANVNDAPVLVAAIGNRSGTQGSAFSLDVATYFSDPDGDALTFSATGLPAGLGISTVGLISGTPTAAGTSTVSVTATDPDLESASGSFTLTIAASAPQEPQNPQPGTPAEPAQPETPQPEAPQPEAPQPGTIVIDTSSTGSTLNGNVVITENGALVGGTIDGRVDNRGVITGDVQLGGGTQIDGGIVSGNISGEAEEPALITNATVPAGTRLENVIVGAGTTLDAGVQIGANVRFESDDAIPEAIDLTGALRQLQWVDKDARPVPDLDGDVVTDAPLSLIRSIQLLPQFIETGSDVSQDATNGEIVVITNDTRGTVLPVQVSQAGADDEEGVFITDDGDIVFVTANRRAVLSYPVVVGNDALVAALRSLGLELRYDERTNLQVVPAANGAQTLLERDGRVLGASALVDNGFYYSSRPAPQALPAWRFDAPGLYYHTVPGLLNATGIVFVFRDDSGKLLEQDLVPVPADWYALKAYLEKLPGASNVRIDTQGVVSVTLHGTTVRGRVGYNVNAGTPLADAPAGLVLKPAGDINGDGVGDYVLHYPNGEWQHLLIYPQ